VEDRQYIRSFTDHSDWVLSLSVNPTQKRLATGCFDGQVALWNLEDGSPVGRFLAIPEGKVAERH